MAATSVTARPRLSPEVDAASEFFEIACDFRDPRDAVREAISNAFDAKATSIAISARIETYKGDEELVLEFSDNGEGMLPIPSGDVPNIEAFFGLGRSTRRGDPTTIGTKGHGTKTYFNSRSIELWTSRDGKETYAVMEEPRACLAERRLPQYEFETKDVGGQKRGTHLLIRGYNRNRPKGFSHDELRDFVLWRTKFGSVEREFKIETNATTTLTLTGIGRSEPDILRFGHQFATENYELKKLKQKDPATPTKWFVKKWAEAAVPVVGYPNLRIDLVFCIEGDNAKDYNPMIRRPGRTPKEGMYRVEERYGVWACKDYIPVQPITDWIFGGKRFGTKYHAFVNCQAFDLTANRGDIGNTSEDKLRAIQQTVVEWYERKILNDPLYKKYQEELENEMIHREPKQEEEEFKKRKKQAQQKRGVRCWNKSLLRNAEVELLEPRQEVGVLALFYMLAALNPNLFKFRIVDYDTRKGYDALVKTASAHDKGKDSLAFVEFKKNLVTEFDHSFAHLAGIVCWDCNLGDEDQVKDIAGESRYLKITKPTEKHGYTKFNLVSNDEAHNIEVYVLKHYLAEVCKIEFKPRASE